MSRHLEPLKYDQNNVPILRPFEIEDRAGLLLELTSPDSLHRACATDIAGTIEKLARDHKVRFVLTEPLGLTADGRKIRGQICLATRTIRVDSELLKGGHTHKFNFTVAHELGHLALHRHRPIKNYDAHDDCDDEMRMEFNHAGGAREIAEWQANRYAAALLMPRQTVQTALTRFQVERENPIKLYVGFVYLDDSAGNRRLYAETLSHLSLVYSVSRTVVRIRLQELGLLVDATPSPVRIGDQFRELFAPLDTER